MKIKSMKIVEGKLLLIGEDHELFLKDGVYHHDNGETITVRNHRITNVLMIPDLERTSKEQLVKLLEEWEHQLETIGDDAQLANIDLQNALQKQQHTVQMLSNISKVLHDTAMAVVRKIG